MNAAEEEEAIRALEKSRELMKSTGKNPFTTKTYGTKDIRPIRAKKKCQFLMSVFAIAIIMLPIL